MKIYIATIFREDGEGSAPLFFTSWNELVHMEFDGVAFNGEAYHLKGFFALRTYKVKVDELELDEHKKKLISWATY